MPSLRTSGLRSGILKYTTHAVLVAALAPLFLASSCGPGLVAAGGGSVGAIFGLQSSGGDEKKKKNPPAPTTNVAPAVIVTALIREESPARIQYTILDANSDVCSVEVQYRVGAGSFLNCLQGTGPGDGTTGLASTPAGTPHVFSWDFASDTGIEYLDNVTIRVRANDGEVNSPWSELLAQEIGNDGPEVLSMTPPPSLLRIVPIEILLADTSGDLASIHVSYSIDQGQNFTPIEPSEYLGGGPVNLLTSAAGNTIQFFWIAELSEPDFVGEVFLLMQAYDQPSGYSDVTPGRPFASASFTIDTSINGPPSLVLLDSLDGKGFVGRVPISITLADNESDASAVVVQFTLDDGVNWQPCTLVSQFVQGIAGPFVTAPSPTTYTVVWDALTDLATQVGGYVLHHPQVRLAMFAADAQPGDIVLSDDFQLWGNSAPAVTSFAVYQDSGNVPFVITATDENSDPVSVTITLSVDGTNYPVSLTSADFLVGDPTNLVSSPAGSQNVLIWNSNIALFNQNYANVTLRITPTDHPPSATPVADLTGATFTTSGFPIINDASGLIPTSINVITWDNIVPGVDTNQRTVLPGGLVHLDRTISPAAADGPYNTLWKIFEQGGNYGSLINGGLGAQVFATGLIEVLATVVDGDTFTIDDGFNGSRTFEFDNNSVMAFGHTPVDILGAVTASDIAMALVAAINLNDQVRVDASINGPGASGIEILLTHQIGCRLGNESGPGSQANPMAFNSAGAGVVIDQMSGGAGSKYIVYQAPTTPPGGSEFVTLVCEIDDPAYYQTVLRVIKLYWGAAPTSVSVTPPTASVSLGGTLSLSSQVLPAGANQGVTWEMSGGTGIGFITQGGQYLAPSTMPNSNPVYAVARSKVNSNILGWCEITLFPQPTNVIVTPVTSTGPGWNAPDLNLGASVQFDAAVTPAGAPQTVNWHIFWNSNEWGMGTAQVGSLNIISTNPPRVQYTAPNMPLSPDTLQIRAVSTENSSVIGSSQVRLIAPLPTSFAVTPSSATVTAGGLGVQFNTTAWVPTNANQSVSWSVSGVGTISTGGFYTPPPTAATVQNATVTATSIPAGTVFAMATVQINPNSVTLPSSITITPPLGVCASGGASLQLQATVLPAGASQSVSWSFVGTAHGTLNTGSGLYEPPTTGIDRSVTIRATSTVSTFVTADVEIHISGDGQQWQEVGFQHVGRGDATTLWETTTDSVWVIGGRSEGVAITDHDPTPIRFDMTTAANPVAATGPTIGYSGTSNTIAAAVDTLQKYIYAVIGRGSLVDVEVWRLDLQGLPTAVWERVLFPATGNVPKLADNSRYHCWYDADARRLMLMTSNTAAHQLDLDMLGVTPHVWLTPRPLGSTALSPSAPQLCGMAQNTTLKELYFVGPESSGGGAATQVYKLDPATWNWSRYNSLGKPSAGLFNPCVGWDGVNNKLLVYSGSGSTGLVFSTDLYQITLGASAQWVLIAPGATELRPPGRGEGMMVDTPSEMLMYGGMNSQGSFGDLWSFNRGTQVFSIKNAQNIRPQGRSLAAGAMDSGVAYIYGGLCDHGPSDELWSLTYNTLQSAPVWTRVTATGTRPPRLRGATMVFDEATNVYLMFGGDQNSTGTGGLVNSVYAFDPQTSIWTLLTPSGTVPSARRFASMAPDKDRSSIWLFGGETSATVRLNDLYRLNLSGGLGSAQWITAASSGSIPSPREGALLGYDSEHGDRLFVLGGNTGTKALFQYEISKAEWTQLAVSNAFGQERDVYRSQGRWIDSDAPRFVHLPAGQRLLQGVVMTTGGPWWQYMSAPPTTNNATAGVGLYDEDSGTYFAVMGERTSAGRNVGVNGFRKFKLE